MNRYQTQSAIDNPMTAGEIENLMMRYDRLIITMIARCTDRTEQNRLINMWNDPSGFDHFVDKSIDIFYGKN